MKILFIGTSFGNSYLQYLTLKRPGTGILFTNRSKVLGKYAKKNLKKDHQIRLIDLKK